MQQHEQHFPAWARMHQKPRDRKSLWKGKRLHGGISSWLSCCKVHVIRGPSPDRDQREPWRGIQMIIMGFCWLASWLAYIRLLEHQHQLPQRLFCSFAGQHTQPQYCSPSLWCLREALDTTNKRDEWWANSHLPGIAFQTTSAHLVSNREFWKFYSRSNCSQNLSPCSNNEIANQPLATETCFSLECYDEFLHLRQ